MMRSWETVSALNHEDTGEISNTAGITISKSMKGRLGVGVKGPIAKIKYDQTTTKKKGTDD